MNEIGKHEPECNDRCTGDSHFLSGTASCDVCDTGFAMEQHDCPKRTLPQFSVATMNRISVLRHLANNLLRDSVEREACEWAANEITTLRGAMNAQDEREARAGERCGLHYEHHGCDWPDAAAEEILSLRKAINDAISYCYKFEREHVAGHPGMGALLPILQDLQAAVGR